MHVMVGMFYTHSMRIAGLDQNSRWSFIGFINTLFCLNTSIMCLYKEIERDKCSSKWEYILSLLRSASRQHAAMLDKAKGQGQASTG